MHGGHATVICSEVREKAVIGWKGDDRKLSRAFWAKFCLPTTTHSLATYVVTYGFDPCSLIDRSGMNHDRRAKRHTPLLF